MEVAAVIANGRQHPRQGVGGTDLVVPIGADQQQMTHLRVKDEMLDQLESGPVEPLQIVEEQYERMLGSREHAEKAPEYELEPRLLILRRQLGRRRLLADDERELGHEIDHQLTIGAQCLEQCGTPSAHLRIGLAKDLMDEALEGLSQRRIGDVALVPVELARREESARLDQLLVKLVDERG